MDRVGTFTAAATVLLLACGILGCGASGPPTYAVSGTVTFNGAAIDEGSIVFDPADGQGPSAMGGIRAGTFTADVTAGEKILRINAVRTSDEKDQYGERVTESYIPARFNQESDIRRTVTAGEPNRFELELGSE
jgi:hypothetical protein